MIARVALCLALGGCLAKPDSPAATPSGHIEYVQSNSLAINNGETTAVTLAMPTHDGDLLVAVVATYPPAATQPVVADNAGNVYQPISIVGMTPGGSKVYAYYVASATASDSLTVSTTAVGAGEATLAVHEYAGADRDAPLDQKLVAMGSSRTPSTGVVTAMEANELFLGILCHDDSTQTTPGAGYTLRELPTDDSAYVPLMTEDQIAPGTTQSADFTLGMPASWVAIALTFR